jgi:large subunit ribosomal protein L29
MSPEERRKRLNQLRTELMRLRTMIKAGGAVENFARIREIRKTIARILTIEHEERLKMQGETKQ